MTLPPFAGLPTWAMFAVALAHFGAGFVLGTLYFRSLWLTARRITDGGNLIATIALGIGRLAALGAVLACASLEGAIPLLVMALGVMVARYTVTRAVRDGTT